MNFTTPKTDKLPEIIWDEQGLSLGIDNELSVYIVYGIGIDDGEYYIGTGHFINGELKDVYEIEKREFLFRRISQADNDVTKHSRMIQNRMKSAGIDYITGKFIKDKA